MARRGADEGSIFQRTDGRWCARVGMPNGRRKYFYGRTRREVAERLTDALKARKDNAPLPDDRQTFGAFLDRWLAGLPGTVRPSTVAYYERYVHHHVPRWLARRPINRLGADDLQRLYAEKLAEGLSTTTVHHLHAILHRALHQAARWGATTRNVAQLVDPPRMRRLEMAVLTEDEVRRFVHVARRDRLGALFLLAVTAGLRQGELLALRWRDVHLERGDLAVTGTLQGQRKDTRTISEPKTHRSRRRVALTAPAVDALRDHRANQAAERLRAGSLWVDSDLVFTNECGGFLTPSVVSRRLDQLLAQAGLPRIRFHDLRHTAATLMLGRGVHPKIASEMLGHASVAITLDLYSHVTPVMQRAATSAVEAALLDGLPLDGSAGSAARASVNGRGELGAAGHRVPSRKV